MKLSILPFLLAMGAAQDNVNVDSLVELADEAASFLMDSPSATMSDEKPTVELNVEVDIDCGVDIKDMSLKALGFSSKAIQRTYNRLHQDLDDGGIYLADLHFDHVIKKRLSSRRRKTRDWPWSHRALWFCCFVPQCIPDDDTTATNILGDSGADLKAWELELAATFQQSDFPALQKVDKCSISVQVVPDKKPRDGQMEVDVDCGIDVEKMTLTDLAMASQALAKTYQKVYGEELKDVHFDHFAKHSTKLDDLERRRRWIPWRQWAAYFVTWPPLYNADDDWTLSADALLPQWETELAFELATHAKDHPIFSKVKRCEIVLQIDTEDLATDE